MKEKEKETTAHSNTKIQPYRMRLPSFVLDEEIGLGDVIKRVTYTVGIRPGSGCGCNRRAEALNRRVVFSPKR